ncbi:hypothetical protein GCM10027343_01330 [Noviherbaspirillum agri]
MAIPSINTSVSIGMESLQKGSVAAETPVAARPAAAPAEAVTSVQQPGTVPNMRELDHALDNINKIVQIQSPGLEFSIDPDSNRTIVKVIDRQTQEVLRQIPSEEALKISKSLDQLTGLLIRQKA